MRLGIENILAANEEAGIKTENVRPGLGSCSTRSGFYRNSLLIIH